MRGMWALLFAGAVVLAGLAGVTGALLLSPAVPALTQPALVQPDRAGARPAQDRPDRVPVPPLPEAGAPVPRTSTATRHVRSPQEAAESGVLHPATDRVMALLIGWVLLASLGGGLLAPRH